MLVGGAKISRSPKLVGGTKISRSAKLVGAAKISRSAVLFVEFSLLPLAYHPIDVVR